MNEDFYKFGTNVVLDEFNLLNFNEYDLWDYIVIFIINLK